MSGKKPLATSAKPPSSGNATSALPIISPQRRRTERFLSASSEDDVAKIFTEPTDISEGTTKSMTRSKSTEHTKSRDECIDRNALEVSHDSCNDQIAKTEKEIQYRTGPVVSTGVHGSLMHRRSNQPVSRKLFDENSNIQKGKSLEKSRSEDIDFQPSTPSTQISLKKPTSSPTGMFGLLAEEFQHGRLLTTSMDDISIELQQEKRQRIYKFLIIPKEIEKLVLFGFLVCLNSFLSHFSVVALRCLITLWDLLRFATYTLISWIIYPFLAVFRGNKRRRGSVASWWRSLSHRIHSNLFVELTFEHAGSLVMIALVSAAVIGLRLIDTSRAYHLVKGQSTIKLYVIFNLLEVFDRLCCSFGQDILESLLWTTTMKELVSKESSLSARLRALSHITTAMVYVFLHSLVLFFQVVTLNVSVNAHNNVLVTLMVSNQFVEIKGAVFKRFERENLFQISCADIAERFQLFVYLFIVVWLNRDHLSFRTVALIIIVYASEMAIDWLKHAFITKFNRISHLTYSKFSSVLAQDIVDERNAMLSNARNENITSSSGEPMVSVVHRIGFVPLPLASILVTSILQGIKTHGSSISSLLTYIAIIGIIFVLKAMVGRFVLIYAQSLINENASESEEKPEPISTVERYSMYRGRIP